MSILLSKLGILLGELGILLGELTVAHQDFGITLLDDAEILVLNIHLMTHVGIGSSHSKAMKDTFHVGIVAVITIVNLEQTAVIGILAGLVEDAQHPVQTVVNMAMETGNLNDDAIVSETIYKCIWKPLRHYIVVIVA